MPCTAPHTSTVCASTYPSLTCPVPHRRLEHLDSFLLTRITHPTGGAQGQWVGLLKALAGMVGGEAKGGVRLAKHVTWAAVNQVGG